MLFGKYASRASEAKYPSLWRGKVFGFCPSVTGPTGLRAYDLSGRNNHGTLTNMDAGTDWVTSQGRYALDFDGSNDFIAIPYLVSFPFTLSCWVQSRTVAADQYVFSLASSSSNGPNFALVLAGGQTGDPIWAVHEPNTGTAPARSSSAGAYVVNEWYHLAGVFLSSSFRQLYVNGIAQAANTSLIGATTVDRMSIGNLNRLSPAAHLNGLASDASVYDRALSPNEIRLLATRPGIAYELAPRRWSVAMSYRRRTQYAQLVGGGII